MSTNSSVSRLQELLPQLFQASEIKGDLYLNLNLDSELSSLISMDNVQESLFVSSEKITPIPNMPKGVMGLMSSRDAVFLVMDLPQLMGLSPLSMYLRQYNIVVLDYSKYYSPSESYSEKLLIGFAVHKIQRVNRVLPEEITTLENPDAEIENTYAESELEEINKISKHYFSGIIRKKEGELMILDLGKILSLIIQPVSY